MTLEQLSHNYFHDWLSGKYNEGEFMGKLLTYQQCLSTKRDPWLLRRMKISLQKQRL
jgi:hypothetical protein